MAGDLRRAAEAFGAYGRNTSRWYEWSLRVITARLATRRGAPDEALAIAQEGSGSLVLELETDVDPQKTLNEDNPDFYIPLIAQDVDAGW